MGGLGHCDEYICRRSSHQWGIQFSDEARLAVVGRPLPKHLGPMDIVSMWYLEREMQRAYVITFEEHSDICSQKSCSRKALERSLAGTQCSWESG